MTKQDIDLKKATQQVNTYVEQVKKPQEEKEKLEKIEEFQKIIQTEKELLKQFHPKRLELEILYQKKLYKFQIRPLQNTDDIETIGLDFNTYIDLNDLEKEIIKKKTEGKKLNQTEKNIYKKTETKLSNKFMGNALEQANHILATFLTPPTYNRLTKEKRYKKKLEFWQNFPFDLKMYIFSETMNRLGINPENEIKLFQVH
jgi:hypothetical protein